MGIILYKKTFMKYIYYKVYYIVHLVNFMKCKFLPFMVYTSFMRGFNSFGKMLLLPTDIVKYANIIEMQNKQNLEL